ncbi:unnamed protein product [Clonostachys rosea]|uniref:NADH-cytochrome b5 reductase n=1 Tax=Bionectria ochroleuca TaxID=29856 RepID=A0ABY6TVV8_BIOOC|nr:unnamed protein product [Clonostachys rosea]
MATSLLPRIRPVTVLTTVLAGGIATGIYSKFIMQEVHADSGPKPKKVLGGGPAFLSLPLESSEMVSGDTKRLRFKLPKEEDVSGLPLTSAVLTVSWPKGSWRPVPRPYTPVTPSDDPGHLDLVVKQYPNGRASTHLHSLSPGEKLLFAFPIYGPKWQPSADPGSHVTLIAGGAGITPVFQLAQGILRNPDDKTSITLVYGANTDRDVLLKKELDAFEREFPGRFKAVYTISRPGEDSPYRKGRVTKELLQEVAPASGSSHVYLCGPPAMETALAGQFKWGSPLGILAELGYRKDQIHRF